MKSNKTLTNNILDLTCLKDIVSGDNDEIIFPDCLSPDFLLIFKMMGLLDFKVTYVLTEEVCSECGCKLHSNGYHTRKPNGINVSVKDYSCPECGNRIVTNFNEFIDNYSVYTSTVKEWGVKLSEIGEESYDKKSELFEALFDIHLPKSTVFYHEKNTADSYLEEKEKQVEHQVETENLKDSGTYHYDEQFPSQNGEYMSRLMIIDANTQYPYEDFLEYATLFDTEIIEKYFHQILDDIPHEIMITEGYSAYPTIIEEFKMIQQRCVFHMMYNVGMEVYPVIRRIKRKNKTKYHKLEEINEKIHKKLEKYKPHMGPITDKKQKKLHDDIKKLEKEIKNIKKQIKHNKKQIKELNNCLERISNIFKAENIKLAKGRLSHLTNNIQFLPDSVATSVKRIKNNFNELTQYLNNEVIPKTNNMIELYFKTTLPRQLKRRYRTIRGLKIKLKSARIRWIHRNVLQNKKPINNFFKNNPKKPTSP
ncbi:hypothetical protein PXD04_08100 [Methanosphaera sp. ISO3-F5]|uniref:hypothetical protein n=1 Tax=Methanosphaera sp. ISO3-F5 TaxID=1452353 RepID=UPI002B262323|nr:hypothetical protein [Methanosphaera sp. ISO3-F5]WQH63655.1 hypothetical protein PXD04_08100 [Methanosphaera sp. ISO3-F5]